MFKTFKEFVKKMFESAETVAPQQFTPKANDYDKAAWKKKVQTKVDIPLSIKATDEQIRYAEARMNSFGANQKKAWDASPLLKNNARNGLIAEVVIADALGIERAAEDTGEEHYSDGGVDIMINGVPCDVKCKTINSADRKAKNQLPISAADAIGVVRQKPMYQDKFHFKNSLYIVGAIYDEATKEVYVVGAMETRKFFDRNTPGYSRKEVPGSRAKEKILRDITCFTHPHSIEDLISQVDFKSLEKTYGYEWDEETKTAVKKHDYSFDRNKSYKGYNNYKGYNRYNKNGNKYYGKYKSKDDKVAQEISNDAVV